MDLRELIKEPERQKESKLDLIVDTSTLKAVPDEKDGIRLEIPGYGEFPLTNWAHGQLADKLGILRKYYERMRSSGKSELLAENVNAWLREKERRLIRILDGRIRAILSDRYRARLNVSKIAENALKGALKCLVRNGQELKADEAPGKGFEPLRPAWATGSQGQRITALPPRHGGNN